MLRIPAALEKGNKDRIIADYSPRRPPAGPHFKKSGQSRTGPRIFAGAGIEKIGETVAERTAAMLNPNNRDECHHD
jgi:hypothetical protein